MGGRPYAADSRDETAAVATCAQVCKTGTSCRRRSSGRTPPGRSSCGAPSAAACPQRAEGIAGPAVARSEDGSELNVAQHATLDAVLRLHDLPCARPERGMPVSGQAEPLPLALYPEARPSLGSQGESQLVAALHVERLHGSGATSAPLHASRARIMPAPRAPTSRITHPEGVSTVRDEQLQRRHVAGGSRCRGGPINALPTPRDKPRATSPSSGAAPMSAGVSSSVFSTGTQAFACSKLDRAATSSAARSGRVFVSPCETRRHAGQSRRQGGIGARVSAGVGARTAGVVEARQMQRGAAVSAPDVGVGLGLQQRLHRLGAARAAVDVITAHGSGTASARRAGDALAARGGVMEGGDSTAGLRSPPRPVSPSVAARGGARSQRTMAPGACATMLTSALASSSARRKSVRSSEQAARRGAT